MQKKNYFKTRMLGNCTYKRLSKQKPMAIKSKTTTLTVPSDVVFEPYSEWKNVDGVETLVLQIPDFKKNQLRVQVNNLGALRISGEKPLTEDGKRKSRFLKEAKLPEGCDINDIRAKFTGGQLHVSMPVKAQTAAQPAATASAALPSGVTQEPKAEDLASGDKKVKASGSGAGIVGAITSHDGSKDHLFGPGGSRGRFQVHKKVSVSLGVAIVAVVAIGAYVVFTYGSSPSPPSHIEE